MSLAYVILCISTPENRLIEHNRPLKIQVLQRDDAVHACGFGTLNASHIPEG